MLKLTWTSIALLLSINVVSQVKLNFDYISLINHEVDTIEITNFGDDNLFLVVSNKTCIGCEVFLSSNLNLFGAILVPFEFMSISSLKHLINSYKNENVKKVFVLNNDKLEFLNNSLSPSLILQSDKSFYYYDYETLKKLTNNFKKTRKLIRSIDKLKNNVQKDG
jgi:hypothetical protein